MVQKRQFISTPQPIKADQYYQQPWRDAGLSWSNWLHYIPLCVLTCRRSPIPLLTRLTVEATTMPSHHAKLVGNMALSESILIPYWARTRPISMSVVLGKCYWVLAVNIPLCLPGGCNKVSWFWAVFSLFISQENFMRYVAQVFSRLDVLPIIKPIM